MLKMTDGDPYSNLANAIIIQAARDYMAVYKKTKRSRSNKAALQEAKDLEDFFHSSWYSVLTSVDPDFLIQSLRKKVDE